AFPSTKWTLSASSFHCTASLLADRRLPPGVVASSRRTSMLLPTHCWNASVRPSDVHESTSPLPPALLVIGPPPGHVQTRSAPVATPNTSIPRPAPPLTPPPPATPTFLPS